MPAGVYVAGKAITGETLYMAGEHEIVLEHARTGNAEPDAFHTELNNLRLHEQIKHGMVHGGISGGVHVDEARPTKESDTRDFDNHRRGDDPIVREAANIAYRMDYGDGRGAANELNYDLYNLRGSRYEQDELLSEVNRYDRKYVGADILLNAWDSNRGTWDDVEILQNNGMPNIPITVYDYATILPWDDPKMP